MSSDRRAVTVLLVLGVVGGVVRLATHSSGPPGALAYYPASSNTPRVSLDSVAARAGRLARPLRRGETIDLDLASAEEISRLPRIGPGLAARIAADRDEHGAFGSIEELDRVSGIGPSVLQGVKPYVTFSGKPDRRSLAAPATSPNRLTVQPSNRRPVSLNTATVEELDQLPGIGPAKAKAIVEDRERRGPYETLDDLSRVPGLRKSTVQGLKGRVIVP